MFLFFFMGIIYFKIYYITILIKYVNVDLYYVTNIDILCDAPILY